LEERGAGRAHASYRDDRDSTVKRGVFFLVFRRLGWGTTVPPVVVSDLGCGHCGIQLEQVTSSKGELCGDVIDKIVILGTSSNNRKQHLVTSTCNSLPSQTMLIDAFS
jgi:hypothetical protein